MTGIAHWCDAGACSWYEFAAAVREGGVGRGLLQRPAPLEAVATGEVPAAAARPAYSVLDAGDFAERIGIDPLEWRLALGRMLDAMASGTSDG